MHSHPSSYGIEQDPVTKTCYDSKSGAVCAKPATFLYFDSLHPVTSVHKMLAEKINAVVEGRNTKRS